MGLQGKRKATVLSLICILILGIVLAMLNTVFGLRLDALLIGTILGCAAGIVLADSSREK